MMSAPTEKDIERAQVVLNCPEQSRSDDDNQFLAAFAQRWLENKTPSEMAANEKLFPVYRKWRDERWKNEVPEAPEPDPHVYALQAAAGEIRTSSSTRPTIAPPAGEDEEVEEQPAGSPASARPPRTFSGMILSDNADATDEDIARFLNRNQSDKRSEQWVRRAAKAAMAGALLAAGYGGFELIRGTLNAAKQAGGKVEQIQKDVGNFADESGETPDAPLPKFVDQEEDKREKQPEKQREEKAEEPEIER